MEHMKDACIPAGSSPAVEIKHYSDDLYPIPGKSGESPLIEDEENYSGVEDTDLFPSGYRDKGRRSGALVKIPTTRRYPSRTRIQHIPYQHIPL